MSLTITFKNISHLAPISDYRYGVYVGDGTKVGSQTIEEGIVTGHHRDDGWEIHWSRRSLANDSPSRSLRYHDQAKGPEGTGHCHHGSFLVRGPGRFCHC